jgi:hypothetical protein
MTGSTQMRTQNTEDATPWGESFDDLAAAVLGDKDAPPVLLLSAFLHQHGAQENMRSLVTEAVALNEAEA